MIVQDIPPYCVAQGDRAKLRGLNTVGMQRSNFTKEQIHDVRKVYRHLFKGNGSMADKMSSLPKQLASQPHISSMIEFIKSSERGICNPSKSSVEEE